MKLAFKKIGQDISVKMKVPEQIDFDYIKMIKYLMEDNKFEESEFEGEFTKEEKQSVETMLKGINDAITKDNTNEVNKQESAEATTIKYEAEIKPEDLPF